MDIYGSQSQRPLQFRGNQLSLDKALGRRSIQLQNMYRSAILVLQDATIPSRIELAAHSLREMVKLMPKYLDIQQPVPPNIKDLINNILKSPWERCESDSSTRAGDEWDGQTDQHSRNYLKASAKFFKKYAEELPIAYELNAVLIRALEPSGSSLPKPLEKRKVDQWSSFYKYFASVAHFQTTVGFDSKLEQLELFLMEALEPKTFDANDELDVIIAEGERP